MPWGTCSYYPYFRGKETENEVTFPKSYRGYVEEI